jgi:hypothetical protein
VVTLNGLGETLCQANLPLEGQTAAHDQITERKHSVACIEVSPYVWREKRRKYLTRQCRNGKACRLTKAVEARDDLLKHLIDFMAVGLNGSSRGGLAGEALIGQA